MKQKDPTCILGSVGHLANRSTGGIQWVAGSPPIVVKTKPEEKQEKYY